MMRLVVENGPECPECGCQASKGNGEATESWDGKRYQRRVCAYCGNRWRACLPVSDASHGVGYVVGGAQCPSCGAFPLPVTSSPRGRPRVRKHKCSVCGWTGKSVEE